MGTGRNPHSSLATCALRGPGIAGSIINTRLEHSAEWIWRIISDNPADSVTVIRAERGAGSMGALMSGSDRETVAHGSGVSTDTVLSLAP